MGNILLYISFVCFVASQLIFLYPRSSGLIQRCFFVLELGVRTGFRWPKRRMRVKRVEAHCGLGQCGEVVVLGESKKREGCRKAMGVWMTLVCCACLAF